MTTEKMIEIAVEEGFADAAVISTKELVFRPEFRMICEDNACGNYGRNYGCPPACGPVEEMRQRMLSFEHALVFQSMTEMEDVFDASATKSVKKNHTALTLKVLKRYEKEGLPLTGLTIMAGPCNFCAQCKLLSGEPCVFPDMRFSCLSAYCIDSNQLAESCHMEFSWNNNIATFFSIYCF